MVDGVACQDAVGATSNNHPSAEGGCCLPNITIPNKTIIITIIYWLITNAKLPVLFDETCISNNLLPSFTNVCVCLCVCVFHGI